MAEGTTKPAKGTIYPRSRLVLRRVQLVDARLLRIWRNASREWMGNTRPVTVAEHRDWLRQILANPQIDMWIGETHEPVGSVRVTRWPTATEIGIIVAPEARGRGLGRTLIRAAAERERGLLFASIRIGNVASQRAFAAAGFERSEQAGTFVRYERAALQPPDDH